MGNMRFREIAQPKSRAACLAEQILKAIREGAFKVGDRFPSAEVFCSPDPDAG